MNRDHLLSALAGVLCGFVAAYFAFETIGSRQPQRLSATEAATAAAAQTGAGAAGGPNAEALAQVAQLERFVAANPDNTEAALALGNAHFDLKNWDGAIAAYESYLSRRPDDADVLTDLGVCLQQARRFEEALQRYDRAQQLQPDHWKSRYNEVVALAFGLGRMEDAERVLLELRRLQPDNPDIQRLADAVAERRGAA